MSKNPINKRFLSIEHSSANEQFVALMDSAVNLSGISGFELGIALTAEQQANLTQDIVWMEEKIVNNQKVLVPVVYLARDKTDIETAATISANEIELNVKNSITNSGTIKAKEDMTIAAKDFTNNAGVVLSGGKATLVSKDDFINKNGGSIKGENVDIASIDGSVINETYSQKNTINQGVNNYTYTTVGKQSSIEATDGNLVITAKKDITNTGANLKANESVALVTQEGDINLNAIEMENARNDYGRGGFVKNQDIGYKTSDIEAYNIIMQSAKDINLEASKLSANNQINLNAKNDINVTALNDVHYTDEKTTKKGFLSSSSKRDMVYKETVNSSEMNANDIVLNAQNDVNLQASKLKAQDNIIVNAEDGDVNIVAKEYREGELHERSKSSFGGLKSSVYISSTDALKLNSALLQTEAANVVITSGKDINVLASDINSAGDIQLKALNDVLIASQQEYLKTLEVHEKSSFNLGALTSLVVPVEQTLYSKEIHNNEKVSSTSKASNLNAKNNIIVDSGSTTIVGSNLTADNNISIKADTGEINILSSQDVTDATSLDKKVEVTISGSKIAKEISKWAVPGSGGLNSLDGDTIVKFELGSLNYDKVDKSTSTVTNNASNLNAKNNLVLDSLTDTNIVGSNLNAGENLVLNSTVGDINILNSTDTYKEDKKEEHAKAALSVTAQNEYVETAKSVKSAVDSAEQLKQTKDDYSKYKSEVKKLENTLSDLKDRYKAKEAGIDYEDLEDLESFIDDLKSQEKYYLAAISAATADLASKTAAIASQANAAANSTYTWGFSVGLQLDVNGEKSKQDISNQVSNASNLSGKNIYVNTDESKDTNINIIGSNLTAKDDLYLNTKNLNVLASSDSYLTSQDKENLDGSLAYTIYGGGGGRAYLGYGKNNSTSSAYLNNNSNLKSNNMYINASNDATFKGATVRADENLNLNVGNNLVLESVRDEFDSRNKGFNVSAGIGFGSDGAKTNRTPSLDVGDTSSANGGFSTQNGSSQNRQTNLSSITGKNVNINVGKNTHLKGSLIAAGNFDENGKFIDNGNLDFTTGSLTYGNLSNSSYSSNKDISLNANYNFNDKYTQNQKEEDQQKGISNVGYTASNDLSASSSKNLATLGTGNITVKDIENSDDLERLNRDTEQLTKDLYDSSTGTKVDATLDTRLLTEEGREQIKEEYKELDENMSAIADTLPNAKSENHVESVIGEVWNGIGMGTLDILPSNGNNGGVLGNIPGWFGEPDNLFGVYGDEKSSFVYINGILNSLPDAMQGGKNIIGGNQSFINLYNPSRGILGDLVEAAVDKWGNDIGMQTGVSKQIQNYLESNKDKNVFMHSQGNLITKLGALSSTDNGHTYFSYGAPMSDGDISKIFNIREKKDIRKNPGDYVANPINIFDPTTWDEPGHGTENYKPIQ